MNPDAPMTPREQTEMRLTALLMGELSAEETVALHAQIAADPGLAKLHARLRQAMELLREATAEPEPATPTPAQLSSERRERLLAHFKSPAPQSAKPAPIVKPPRSVWSWVVRLGAAAAVVVILAGLLFPAIAPVKMSAKRGANAESPLPESQDSPRRYIQRSADGDSWISVPPNWPAKPAASTNVSVGSATISGTIPGRSTSRAGKGGDSFAITEANTYTGGAASNKYGATALYLPPTTDAPVGGEAPQIQLPSATIANFNGLNAPVTRDAVPPRPTHTADSKLNRMGGLGGNGMGVGIGGIGGMGGGTSYGLSGTTRQHPNLDNTLVGQEALAAATARTAAEFDGSVDFGSAFFQATPGPTARSTPMPQSGKDLPDLGQSAALPADGDKQIEIKAKNMEIAQNNLQELNLGHLAGGERAKANLKTAADGTIRDEPSGPRRPADKEEGEKLKSSKAQKAPPPIEVGADVGEGSEGADAAGERAGEGRSEGQGKADAVPRMSRDLAKRKDRAADPFVNIDARRSEQPALEPADVLPAPAPPPLPSPPSSVPLPVVTAPAGEETAIEMLFKTIDEMKPLGGGQAGKGKGGKEAATRPETEALKSDLATNLAHREKLTDKAPQAARTPEPATPAPVVSPDVETTGWASIDQWTKTNAYNEAKNRYVREKQILESSKVNLRAELMKRGISSARTEEEYAQQQLQEQRGREMLYDQIAKGEAATRAASEELAKLRAEAGINDASLSEVGASPKATPLNVAKEADEKPAARPAQPAAIPQPEVATSANAFSTFSLNVSDVAFKLAGASLEKGQMPELATVRSEEFINAFDYRDPEPAAGAPLAFATERARYPFAQNRDLVRFSVKTAAAGRQPGRPLNLVLLLDNSGSMERADRVRILREALRVLAAQLQPQDRLSVVAFARTPRLWADGVTGDKAAAAVARVGEITPQGGTNLEAALDLGYATALKHYQPGSISRVVLLTDGAANLGDVNPDALKRKVETNRQRGVALDCFGIGWEGYDDTLLETLARNGDGRYGFINTPEEAASGFAAQLAGALRVAASDVKVQVEWNPRRVTAYRQIGSAKHQLKKEQFRDNTVDAAEIGAAESGNALYVVEVNPRGEGDLATVRVRFKVPGTADYKEHEWAVPFTKDAPSLEQASPALRLAGTASAFSEWLTASPYAAEVTTDRLLGLLNGVPANYAADPRPKKLEWMIRTAKSVSGR
jgi:Mg-chelatase subunit ChlD